MAEDLPDYEVIVVNHPRQHGRPHLSAIAALNALGITTMPAVTPSMFDDAEHVAISLPAEKRKGGRDKTGRTPDQRRKERNEALIAQGIHPRMGTPVRPDLGTCGTCAHLLHGGSGASNGRFLKCGLLAITNGPGTDLRARWPACGRWEPKP